MSLLLWLLMTLPTGQIALAQSPAPVLTLGTEAGTLKLPAPQTVKVGSGYLRLRADCKSPVAWDVFAVFEDDTVKVQWEDLGDGSIVLGIPASAGAIRVTAAAVLEDGKPPRIVSTVVTIVAPPKPVAAEEPQPTIGPPMKLHVTVLGPPVSPTLRVSVEELGCVYWSYAGDSAELVRRPDLAALYKGTPLVVVQDKRGTVLDVERYTTDAALIDLVKGRQRRK